MKPPSPAQIKRELQQSVDAAALLTTIGMSVIVTDDFGKEHTTTLESLPWALGHGQMIANCKGFPSYITNRIRPYEPLEVLQEPDTMKSNPHYEARFLSVLQRVLPQTVHDPAEANQTYEKVLAEMRLFKSLDSFEKFCEKGSLPDVEPATIAEFQEQLEGNFGDGNVILTPMEDGASVAVEIKLPDHIVNSLVKVVAANAEEPAEAPFVPFPVTVPEDPELVWLLARRENLGPDEAARALANIHEEFWATKKGQILQCEGVERSFAEFVSNVPATALAESGIKRYHKDPETLKCLHLLPDEVK